MNSRNAKQALRQIAINKARRTEAARQQREIEAQARQILTRKRLLRLVSLTDRIYLKSQGDMAVPLGFEKVAGTLVRLGEQAAVVRIAGRTLAVPVQLVRPIAGPQTPS